jgi:pyruvate/2-oxoglutarate/acetoin dehydrogenase E1 component
MTYEQELRKAMEILGNDERVLFLGQSVAYKGTAIFKTLDLVPAHKKIELPIMEDTQMGMCIGLSLEGYIPVSIFPRMDFLICATNQLVNHLDKIVEISDGKFAPKVIVRTAVGSVIPLYPGAQHCSDYTAGLEKMLQNVEVVRLEESSQIVPAYKRALEIPGSSLLIEISDNYDKE